MKYDLDELRGRLASEIKEFATPINFEELEKQGLISKCGLWYRVPNLEALPKNVQIRINELEQDSKGLKVKFEHVTKKFMDMADKL